MIRLFVAIDLPETAQAFLGSMGGTIPGSRPVPPEQVHLTLKFIGEVDTAMLSDIQEALHTVRLSPFKTGLKGVGYFPPRGTPKVLWAGITPDTEVTRLRNKIEKALADINIPRGKRKFAPHFTICRLKNSPIHKVAEFLAANSFLESPQFTVQEFTLYSSVLNKKGAIHRVEDIIELTGS